MKSLSPGVKHSFSYVVPENKTVPFMIVLMEWACAELIGPYLDAGEGSLGTHVNVSHAAATPPGMTVEVEAEVIKVDGRKLVFKVRAHDGVDLIGEGTHERVVVAWDKFNTRVAQKAAAAGVA